MSDGDRLPGTVVSKPALGAMPTSAGERLLSLDFTRGVAVLGILFANIMGMGQPLATAYTWPGGFLNGHDGLADALWVAQFVLVDGKMRGLFTLLFGAGLILFTDRAKAKGGWIALSLVRLGWLLVFGLAHYYLLWRGDILALYALCGAVVLFAVNWSWVQQLAVGVAVYMAGVFYNTVVLAPLWAANETVRGRLPEFDGVAESTRAFVESQLDDGLREAAIAESGTWIDYVRHSAVEHTWEWWDTFLSSAPEATSLMLVGMALYRVGLFDGRLNRRAQVAWGWAGVIVGFLLTLPLGLWVYFGGFTYTGTVLAAYGPQGLTRLPMVLGLAALCAVWGMGATGWLGSRLSAAGRAAFTNYIGTSLVMLAVFQGWGLGLFGELSREGLYIVAIAGCVIMLLWSKPWLKRYRYGPLEWLWRCLTYRQAFPLRR
ncbi:hypothetical protein A6F68_02442 [Tsuneonella dongtanensis]|uniref:DUF418 domain-containing protein n=1 Tax=Tsuneonella dongtanensis TaxID=692370 RepID=A0A1B2AFL3_9SPHN|nr:DUF418 domain-containing protein [Tsuneonella dongtanensis]ANY20939.1 hypothetical protein A6F68_02442 [Tsuneonella dongtanensis]